MPLGAARPVNCSQSARPVWQRPVTDVKGVSTSLLALSSIHFRKTDPDRAEAQLMCWKPSSKGMVYPRFEATIDTGNVISLEKAWETLVGEAPRKSHLTDIDLLFKMQTLGIRFFAGVDWGYTHDFVIVIFALMPNGDIWIVDCYSQDGLEFSDCLAMASRIATSTTWNAGFVTRLNLLSSSPSTRTT
jgi:hypothetical protein